MARMNNDQMDTDSQNVETDAKSLKRPQPGKDSTGDRVPLVGQSMQTSCTILRRFYLTPFSGVTMKVREAEIHPFWMLL
jgi:hypothetical protein